MTTEIHRKHIITNMTQTLAPPSPHATPARELVARRVTLRGVTWPLYEQLLSLVGDCTTRLTVAMLFSMFCIAGLMITFLGAFFRGPGYAWTLPWQGLYFAL